MKQAWPTWGSILGLVLGCFFHQSVSADQPAAGLDAPLKFVRLARDKSGQPLSLDTAVMRYRPAPPRGDLVVDLIGAVHVGDQSYYELLNRLFTQYDAVLYELVAPAGTRVPKGGRPDAAGNPISMMQDMTRSVLGLASQLDHVDYTRPNLVHADLSAEDMLKAMQARGDNPLSFALNAMADIVRQANQQAQQLQEEGDDQPATMQDMFSLFTDATAGAKLKLMMAEQFDRMGGTEMALGATINEAIVRDRNAAAMKVLRQQVADGQKRLAIFYGAAHMPDFDRRLRDELNMRRMDTEWIKAWDLTVAPQGQASLMDTFLRMLSE